MAKSPHTHEYREFLELLRITRTEAGLTQTDLAEAIESDQSTVSKCERGERRLDVIELRLWCSAMGLTLTSFAQRLESRLRR